VATVLTLVFLPALYALWFRVSPTGRPKGEQTPERMSPTGRSRGRISPAAHSAEGSPVSAKGGLMNAPSGEEAEHVAVPGALAPVR